MTYRSEQDQERTYARRAVRALGLLVKYQGDNWFDDTYDHFEDRLERGLISHIAIPGWFLIRTYCTDCDEPCTAIRYHGRRILVHPSGTEQTGKFWIIHQCPPPTEEIYPDDPEVRDGDGEIRALGWDDNS